MINLKNILVPVANNFRAIPLLGDFRKVFSFYRFSSSGEMLCKIVGYLDLSCQSEPVFCPYSWGQKDAHRSQVYLWKLHSCISAGPSWHNFFTPPLGFLRLCRFALICSFWVSLCAFCTWTQSVLPPPFPAHLWELHFEGMCIMFLPVPFPAYCFLGVSGSQRRMVQTWCLVPQSSGSQAAQFSVSFQFRVFGPVGEVARKGHIAFVSSYKRAKVLFIKKEATVVFLHPAPLTCLTEIYSRFWQ